MPSAITQTNLKQQNFNNTTNPKLHFTPLIPKTSVGKNTTSTSNGSPNLVIKTSKRWILPPRPRPGRRNVPCCNSLNSNNAQSPSASNINNKTNLHNTSSSTNAGNKTKSINVSKKDVPPSKASNNNKNASKISNNASAKQQRAELNYLAFLKFEESDETDRSTSNESARTLIHDSVATTRVTTKNLPLLMISNNTVKEASPLGNVKTASPSDFTKQNKKTEQESPKSPMELSPSSTIVSTPVTTDNQFYRRLSAPVKSSMDKVERIDENAYFQKMYDQMENIQDVDMDFDLFSKPSATVTPESMDRTSPTDDDTKNLTLDNEDELYNTIFEFLPRYTSGKSDDVATTAATKKDSTKKDSSYLYVAPSLEELMDEQDNFMNLFEDTPAVSSNANDGNFNDFLSNDMKNFINTNQFDDEDFDILKTESL